MIGLVLPFMAGIAAGEWAYSIFSGCCAFLFVASLAVAVGGYVLQVFRPLQFRTSRFNLAVVSISIGLMGMALLVNQRDKLQPSWPVGAQTFRGMIMETPRGSSKAHQVEVSLTGGQYDGLRVRLTLMRDTMALHTACSVPEVGNTLLFYTSIEPLRASGNPGDFDYAAWLRRHGISGTGFCAAGYWQLSETAASHLPLTVRLHRWRNALVRRYAEYFQGRDLGVITAMTLGDKTHLDRDTREVYSQAGVSHVLALSGLHLSILFALWNSFLQPLFRCRRLLFIGASLVGVAVLWSFAALAGLPLSLVRATIMFTVMQMTGCFRGHSFSLNNLALAAFIILTVSPQALFDVGFQLSCLSVAGILLIVPRLPQPFLLRRERTATLSCPSALAPDPVSYGALQSFSPHCLLLVLAVGTGVFCCTGRYSAFSGLQFPYGSSLWSFGQFAGSTPCVPFVGIVRGVSAASFFSAFSGNVHRRLAAFARWGACRCSPSAWRRFGLFSATWRCSSVLSFCCLCFGSIALAASGLRVFSWHPVCRCRSLGAFSAFAVVGSPAGYCL